MVRLPAEYQEVEYLESTGTQYIDTGILGKNDLKFYCKIVSTRAYSNTTPLFGAYGNGKRCYILAVVNTGTFGVSYVETRNAGIAVNLNMVYDVFVDFTKGSQSITINGNTYSYVDNRELSTLNNIYLFGYNFNESLDLRYKVYMKLYSFAISDESDLIMNLIPCYRKSDNEPGMYDTVSGIFYTNSGSGTFLVGNDVEWDTASLLERRRQILLNTPHIETVSGSMASFNTDISANLKECKVYFSPVQEGTGDPSPDNVRPITGWDGIEVSHNIGQDFYTYNVTKNLSADKTNISKINNNSFRLYTTSPFEYPSSKQLSTTLGFVSGKRYRIEFDLMVTVLGDGHHINFGFRNSSNSFQTNYTIVRCDESGHYTLDFTFTNTTNLNYLSLCQTVSGAANFDATISNLQIYEVETLTIPFNRTIYGGYVDLVRGEVVETQTKVDISSGGYNILQYDSDVSVFFTSSVPYNFIPEGSGLNYAPKGLLCNSLKPFKGDNWRNENRNTITRDYGTVNRVAIRMDRNIFNISTDATVNEKNSTITEYLSENPIEITYELATPNTYILTPETIKALKGINNIWSNANGNIEISYYSH